MDLQELVDKFHTMTCIVSIEKRNDGKARTVRIEAGNEDYVRSMEKVDDNGNVIFKEKFVPGRRYEHYMKKELNFENFCYECAIKKKPIHAYIRPEYYDFSINMNMMPLSIEDPEKAYCTFSQELSFEENLDEMSNISSKTSSSVLQTCIKLRGAKDLHKTMDEVIEDIRNICGASYCCVLLTDFNENTWSVFSDSLKPGSNQHSIRDLKHVDFTEYARSWIKQLRGRYCLMIANSRDLELIRETNPKWYDSLVKEKIETVALLPLQYTGTLLGFILVTNFDTSNTVNIKETLELSSFFIASEIANYRLLNQLEVLSNQDLLTGLLNRNSMNNKISKFIKGEVSYSSLAVVFADLNGLKPINDSQGHDAGDELLKSAAHLLRDTFIGCDCYRAGGDEFLVIATNQPKEDLEAKVEKLRQDSMIPGKVSFAIGFYYDEHGGKIRRALHEADNNMYEDKKRFYDRFPANRRRRIS